VRAPPPQEKGREGGGERRKWKTEGCFFDGDKIFLPSQPPPPPLPSAFSFPPLYFISPPPTPPSYICFQLETTTVFLVRSVAKGTVREILSPPKKPHFILPLPTPLRTHAPSPSPPPLFFPLLIYFFALPQLVCADIGAKVLIDDAVAYILDASPVVETAILFGECKPLPPPPTPHTRTFAFSPFYLSMEHIYLPDFP
jgi:hypothetical protein